MRPLLVGFGIHVLEELGVGRGVPEGVRLGLGVVLGSFDIGEKEGENTEAGLFDSTGSRCTFL